MPELSKETKIVPLQEEIIAVEFMQRILLMLQNETGLLYNPTLVYIGAAGDLLPALPFEQAYFLDARKLDRFSGGTANLRNMATWQSYESVNATNDLHALLAAFDGVVLSREDYVATEELGHRTELQFFLPDYPLQSLTFLHHTFSFYNRFNIPELVSLEDNSLLLVKAGMNILSVLSDNMSLPRDFRPRAIVVDDGISRDVCSYNLDVVLLNDGYQEIIWDQPYQKWGYGKKVNIFYRID